MKTQEELKLELQELSQLLETNFIIEITKVIPKDMLLESDIKELK